MRKSAGVQLDPDLLEELVRLCHERGIHVEDVFERMLREITEGIDHGRGKRNVRWLDGSGPEELVTEYERARGRNKSFALIVADRVARKLVEEIRTKRPEAEELVTA